MRIILTLLIIAGLITGYFKFETWRKERTEKYWAGECLKKIEPLVRPQGKTLLPDEAAYFKLIHFVQKSKAAGLDVPKMITGACGLLGLQEEAGKAIENSIMDGHAMAQKLQLLDDVVNMINLENGESVEVKIAGWQGEKAAVGQVVPAALAPEAASHLANLQLMPATVRDAQGNTVTASVVNHATTLQSMGVITRESFERVKAAGPQKK